MAKDYNAEVEAERRAIRSRRRAFAQTDGPFVKAMKGAMVEYDKMRKDGVSREDAIRGLEAVLRDSWPFKTTQFPAQCDVCDDTGFREVTCWAEQRCGRKRCAHEHPAFEHAMAVPCDCTAGDRHRAKSGYTGEAIAAVGRRQKRKPQGWTKVGT